MADGEQLRCEQLRLANIVKGVHGRLRKELRQGNGDHEALWRKHCSDQASLSKYAQAMYLLAAEHWTKNSPSGRVEWCHKTAVEFFRQGGLQRCIEKQRKRIQFAGAAKCCCCCCFNTENNSGRCTKVMFPSSKEKLLLLDVGSCFNPFSIYEDLTAVAVDLQPAVESVYKCDFLHLSIEVPNSISYVETLTHCSCFTKGVRENYSQEVQMDIVAQNTGKQLMNSKDLGGGKSGQSASLTDFSAEMPALYNQNGFANPAVISYSHLQPYLGEAEVKKLPSSSFHIVTFSLLLSYFPSPQQRWICCVNAHQLLAVNGLLLIITPDSSHQNRNAPMVKSWKLALESIGFVRWCYVKETHLHCMAFRKVAQCHVCNHADKTSAEMLYIPQDYQEDEEEQHVFASAPRTEEEDLEVYELFSELPNTDD